MMRRRSTFLSRMDGSLPDLEAAAKAVFRSPSTGAYLVPANAGDLVAAMAAQLAKDGLPETERDAIRMLCQRGYRYGDVAALAGAALYAARQMAVTREMSR